MSALVADLAKRWPGCVPYVFGDTGAMGRVWLQQMIYEFNRAVGHDVFVERRSEANYIEIIPGGNSPLGMQGTGRQECRVSETNLYHELGHAVGLGHTYYTRGSEIHTLFESVDKTAYDTNLHEYASFGTANAPSMMAYSPDAFSTSPRIARVARLTHGNRTEIGGVLVRARQRLTAVSVPTVTTPSLGLAPSTSKPRVTRSLDDLPSSRRNLDPDLGKPRSLDLETIGSRRRAPVDPDDISQMDRPTVTQLVADLELIQRYWTFDPGFMLRVHPTDVDAVREVLGIARSSQPTPGRVSISPLFQRS